MKTNETCDREIGSIVKGWHRCGESAVYAIDRASVKGYVHTLHSCSTHHNAMVADMRAIKSLRTTAERVLVKL